MSARPIRKRVLTHLNTIVLCTQQAAKLLQLRPFDFASEEGRAQERHRRAILSAAAAAAAKVVSIGTAFVSVPLTLHYLGVERYGMWMTMSSLIATFAFADLGIGNGVLNAVAAAHGRDDRAAIRGFVSSGFFALSAVALLLIGAFALAYPFVPWFRIFHVETALARAEAGPALAMLVGCFALAIPVGIVQRVQMGLQRGFMASLWQCAGSLFGLGGLLLAIRCEAGLPWLILAFAGAPFVAALGNSLLFFGRTRTRHRALAAGRVAGGRATRGAHRPVVLRSSDRRSRRLFLRRSHHRTAARRCERNGLCRAGAHVQPHHHAARHGADAALAGLWRGDRARGPRLGTKDLEALARNLHWIGVLAFDGAGDRRPAPDRALGRTRG